MADSARLAGMGVLLGCVLFTSACGGGEPTADGSSTPRGPTSSAPPVTSDPPPSPATTSTAPSPTSSRTPTGPNAVAKVNASNVLDRYLRTYDTCLNRPEEVKMSCFDEVAIGTARRNARNALSNEKAYGTKVIGRSQVTSVKPVKVDLTNKPKQQPPVIPTVVFEVCYDVSKVNVVDDNGKSIVPPDRINHGRHRVSVYNYEYPDQSQWRVGYVGDPVKDPSC